MHRPTARHHVGARCYSGCLPDLLCIAQTSRPTFGATWGTIGMLLWILGASTAIAPVGCSCRSLRFPRHLGSFLHQHQRHPERYAGHRRQSAALRLGARPGLLPPALPTSLTGALLVRDGAAALGTLMQLSP